MKKEWITILIGGFALAILGFITLDIEEAINFFGRFFGLFLIIGFGCFLYFILMVIFSKNFKNQED